MRTISIVGAVGTFTYDGKKINGVQLVDVVSQVTSIPDTEKNLTVEISSLGGNIETAKQIRNYLKSLSTKFNITTKQIGDIASAATIIFSVGKTRLAASGTNPETGKPFTFCIHNPYITSISGDAEFLKKESEALKNEEATMVSIYSEDIGIKESDVYPLMSSEAIFTSEQAINLKFATDTYTPIEIAALLNKTQINMQTSEVIAAIKKLLGGEKVAVDGGEQNPLTKYVGKPLQINGEVPENGTYTVIDGVVTVATKVEDKKSAPENPQNVAADAEKIAVVFSEMQKKNEEKIAALSAEILAIKKGTASTHVPSGFKEDKRADDVKEWERSFKAGEHTAMKINDVEKYKRLFFAKYGRIPNV